MQKSAATSTEEDQSSIIIANLTLEIKKTSEEVQFLKKVNRMQLEEICELKVHRYNLSQSKLKLLREKSDLEGQIARQHQQQQLLECKVQEIKEQRLQINREWKLLGERMEELTREANLILEENETLKINQQK